MRGRVDGSVAHATNSGRIRIHASHDRVPVAGLRQHVRDTFLGTSTCTHLNDTLRSLEDIPALLQLASEHDIYATHA